MEAVKPLIRKETKLGSVRGTGMAILAGTVRYSLNAPREGGGRERERERERASGITYGAIDDLYQKIACFSRSKIFFSSSYYVLCTVFP